MMKFETFEDGIVINGDCTSQDVLDLVSNHIGEKAPLIIADPPYGNIVNESWDRVGNDVLGFSTWMTNWTRILSGRLLLPRGAFYVWGGVGRPGFRPFLDYINRVEIPMRFELANLITWSKRRAYGVKNNYLWTREECAYFVNGDAKKPLKFNIPLLDTKRGYAGYNKKYPAKSEHYRRTNVWTDINEIFRGKKHPTQKTQRLHEVMIEVHTDPGDWVIDPFAGAGTTAFAARKLGRKFVIIDLDEKYYEQAINELKGKHDAGEGNSGEQDHDIDHADGTLQTKGEVRCLEEGEVRAPHEEEEREQVVVVKDSEDGQAPGDREQ